jgi:sucrose phosphorylase
VTSTPRDSIRERLNLLYGATAGASAATKLNRVLDGFLDRHGQPDRRPDRFDQSDALLITYGDTFAAAGPPLAALGRFAAEHLEGLVSGVHVLPFFPYSSDYGFAVIDYLRVDPALGGWPDISALGGRFRLMFDLVLNHVSAESPWFLAYLRGEAPYDGFFIAMDPEADLSAVTRPRTSPLLTRFETLAGPRWLWTTFGPDQVDLNYHEPEILVRMVEVMLGYLERGAGLLRLDAVGYLWKEVGTSCIHLPQTHEVVRLLRDVLDAVAPDVAIVTETNVPHRENVSYFGDGRDEAQMVYQFTLAPLVLDALTRGDASHLNSWAETLSTPSDRTTFFNFLASHDGIGVVPARGLLTDAEIRALVAGVRAGGGEVSCKTNPDGTESPYELNSTWMDAISSPDDAWPVRLGRFVCSHAIMLAMAGVPGVYVHSLFGSRNDRQAFARSRCKRDLNHGHLTLDDLARRLRDETDETAQIFARMATLLRARRAQPAFHPNAPQRVLPTGPGVFGLRRGPYRGQEIVSLHNLTGERQALEGPWPAALDLITGRRVETCPVLSLGPHEVLWLGHPA